MQLDVGSEPTLSSMIFGQVHTNGRTESGACEPTMHKNHAKGVIKKARKDKSTLLVPEATFAGPSLSTQTHAFELTWHGILLRALKTIAPTSF